MFLHFRFFFFIFFLCLFFICVFSFSDDGSSLYIFFYLDFHPLSFLPSLYMFSIFIILYLTVSNPSSSFFYFHSPLSMFIFSFCLSFDRLYSFFLFLPSFHPSILLCLHSHLTLFCLTALSLCVCCARKASTLKNHSTPL